MRKDQFDEMVFLGDLKLRTNSLAELKLKRAALNQKIKRMNIKNGMYSIDFWSRDQYKKMMYDTNMIDILERIRLHYLKFVKEVDNHIEKTLPKKLNLELDHPLFLEYL